MAEKIRNLGHINTSRKPRYLHKRSHHRHDTHSCTNIELSHSFPLYAKSLSLSDTMHRRSLSFSLSSPSYSVISQAKHGSWGIQRAPHLTAHAWPRWLPQRHRRTPWPWGTGDRTTDAPRHYHQQPHKISVMTLERWRAWYSSLTPNHPRRILQDILSVRKGILHIWQT